MCNVTSIRPCLWHDIDTNGFSYKSVSYNKEINLQKLTVQGYIEGMPRHFYMQRNKTIKYSFNLNVHFIKSG